MKNQKGITLIALVITIIVMLILVGVSVTVALNGGLFSTAQKATADTEAERDKELALSDGKVEINGEIYNSIDEYVNGNSGGAKVEILPKKETYTVGEEVTIGDEAFFVIADDTEKVTLLAKYNLNLEGTAQSNVTKSEYSCAFSSTNYWSNDAENELDLNTYEVPEGVTSVITTAKIYGEAKGGTGRLMTYEEASSLRTNYAEILFGTSINAIDGYLNYWLSYTFWSGFWDLKLVASNSNILNRDDFGNNGGVRPVVEISKSDI